MTWPSILGFIIHDGDVIATLHLIALILSICIIIIKNDTKKKTIEELMDSELETIK